MSEADAIVASLNDINAGLFADNNDRIRVRDALNKALRQVQNPWEIAWDHVITRCGGNAAIKTLIDVGAFKKWAEAGGEPITCTELAKLVDADEILIRRLMRAIAGQNLIVETDLDTYAPTPWAKALGEDPSLCACFFEYVGSNPLLTADFNDAMEGNSRGNLTDWVDVYPTKNLLEGARPGRPLVVDVGGGKGHDLVKFHVRHPEIAPGSLILQDLPIILKGADVNPVITVQEYDFFTPQPVKGARAYFMHGVLHDWPEPKAMEILQVVTKAMEKGYSKLLIHENMINERGAVARVTSLDILMMGGMAAAERTEGQWRSMVEGAGLKVVKIWRGMDMGECIIEAELA
ncbi:sterigmatocystin 8-o-methyltransferase [Colletotrichum sojae]|uniref:Sterigmatocystin 8-o-methyltransferase n=1 Tax=Colletotrichum sojae TaxID=2175907 RepID=A0A8H6MM01_9PEZI|nr:sterigmatocystin 8-o-methyltransferase [Colletotrichum sojae]